MKVSLCIIWNLLIQVPRIMSIIVKRWNFMPTKVNAFNLLVINTNQYINNQSTTHTNLHTTSQLHTPIYIQPVNYTYQSTNNQSTIHTSLALFVLFPQLHLFFGREGAESQLRLFWERGQWSAQGDSSVTTHMLDPGARSRTIGRYLHTAQHRSDRFWTVWCICYRKATIHFSWIHLSLHSSQRKIIQMSTQ